MSNMSMVPKARINGCVRKNKYPTMEYARDVARVEHEKRGVNLRVYRCGDCLGFHLTHKKPRVFRRRLFRTRLY
jgi:hypothetical protein